MPSINSHHHHHQPMSVSKYDCVSYNLFKSKPSTFFSVYVVITEIELWDVVGLEGLKKGADTPWVLRTIEEL